MEKLVKRSDGVILKRYYLESHPNYKGGRSITKDGYVWILVGDFEFRPSKCRYMFEHRYVMSNHLKRVLRPNEQVHHINGIKTDNRLENLELLDAKDHWKEHLGKRAGTHWKLKERRCPECSNGFFPSSNHNGSSQIYCSKSCAMKSVRRRTKKHQ